MTAIEISSRPHGDGELRTYRVKHLEMQVFYSGKAISSDKSVTLLGHAMFNEFQYFLKPPGYSFVDYLLNHGLNVAVFHLTGYGQSDPASSETNFDTYVRDYEHIIEALSMMGTPVSCYIGHSVGSLAGLSAISKKPNTTARIVLLAPAIWTLTIPSKSKERIVQLCQLHLARIITKMKGQLPTKTLRLGTVSPPLGYLEQFLTWNKRRSVTSISTETVYSNVWATLQAPILVLTGSKDLAMAPPPNIQWIKQRLPQNATFEQVSINSRFGFNADHFGLIYGKQAAETVWPRIMSFLRGEG